MTKNLCLEIKGEVSCKKLIISNQQIMDIYEVLQVKVFLNCTFHIGYEQSTFTKSNRTSIFPHKIGPKITYPSLKFEKHSQMQSIRKISL